MRIERRGETWSARVRVLTVDPATREVRTVQRRISLGSTAQLRTEAQARLELGRRLTELTKPAPGRRALFGPYARRYLQRQVALMRPTSAKQFRHLITGYLLPAWERRPLQHLTTEAVQDLILDLAPRNLSRNTLANVRSAALMVLGAAHQEGFGAPVLQPRLIRLPKNARAPRAERWLTPAEADAVIDAAPVWRAALYACLAHAGLRIGEALGLRFEDVDFPRQLLRIRQAVVLGQVQALKTTTSQADLPMSGALASRLAAHMTPAPGRSRGDLVFTDNGKPWRADEVRRRFLPDDLAAAKVDRVGFHAFRHSLPARLLGNGASPETVRRMMRHSSLEMTQRYTHSAADDLRKVIAP